MTEGADVASVLVAAASELLPRLRESASFADERCDLPAEIVDALGGAGLLRIVQPERFGGAGLGYAVVGPVAAELAKGDASAAWTTVILNNSLVEQFPEAAQADVWAADSRALVANVLRPTDQVERVRDGFRIAGTWPYATGVSHCSWAAVAGRVPQDGESAPYLFLVPAHDYRVEHTWRAVGMRATGSHSIVIDSAHIPHHRAVPAMTAVGRARPGWQLALACTAVGTARTALFERPPPHRSTDPVSAASAMLSSSRARLALACSQVRCAMLLAQHELRRLARGEAGGTHSVESWFSTADIVRLSVGAVDLLFQDADTDRLRPDDALQRCWRDVHTVAAHPFLRWDAAADAADRLIALDAALSWPSSRA